MAETQERLSPAIRPRTAARVAAVQALFQIEQGADAPENVIRQFVTHRFGTPLSGETFEEGHIPEADIHLFTEITRRASATSSRRAALLSETLPASWPVNRLDPVLRAILVAAIAELDAPEAPPAGVVINEYLDVAHGFFSGDETKLVNGVLDGVAKRLRREGEGGVETEDAAEATAGAVSTDETGAPDDANGEQA
ncbi:transcription antitermination factor NusB [Acetobacter nitrogenifigens DSM 23921 = NBRC 105050]|uniref:NusB/RsmB/TIM44 domain-containing protein n=1 Tax=Acetobacter nitrogenifigens DSM 23921 = NBRC 105050 TaxID=1120919 RepID=A0A511XCP7_9PROT|nr:transcription antitermination factor NusB [Acetobacter nitrogenifigens]GBQ92183.1 transcription antitermination factor NusB [Acetobacter nitrogenifigens DSM 23921 = NBRC 105050]GEN60651.1 hypothetical protein ANI02nite_25350 [Acetobacter nitrogenifigens DSM 23921 = NBRC 105050]